MTRCRPLGRIAVAEAIVVNTEAVSILPVRSVGAALAAMALIASDALVMSLACIARGYYRRVSGELSITKLSVERLAAYPQRVSTRQELRLTSLSSCAG